MLSYLLGWTQMQTQQTALKEQKTLSWGKQGKNSKYPDWKKNPSKREDQTPWRGRLHGAETVDGFTGGESTHVGQT